MKRSVFLSVLLAAIVLLVPALVLVGCESLGETGETLAVEIPASENPDAENPTMETPASENPGGATSPSETLAVEHPGGTPAAKTTTTASWNSGTLTLGTVVITVFRYEETDSRLVWAGSWKSLAGGSYSAGATMAAEKAGASVTIKFSGISITLIGTAAANMGIANVTLDGGSPVQVDCYSAIISAQKVLWQSGTIANGSHTVKVEFTGTASPSAAKYPVFHVDAFDVTGTIQ